MNFKYFLLSIFFLFKASELSYAKTWVGGFYESQFGFLKEGDYKGAGWRKHYLDLKFWSSPAGGVEAYFEAHAWTDDWNKRKRFYFNTGYFKYWQKPFDIRFLFKYQNHWLNSPLLYLVDPYVASNYSNSESLRISVGRNFTFIYTDNISDSNYNLITRFSKRFFSRRRNVVYDFGLNLISAEGLSFRNRVFSGDISILRGITSFVSEFGIASDLYKNHWDKQDFAYEIEMRDLRINDFYITGGFYNYGRDFISRVSNKFYYTSYNMGRAGYTGEFKYLFPKKAVDIIYKLNFFKTAYNDSVNDLNTFYDEEKKFLWKWAGIRAYFLKGIDTTFAYETNEEDLLIERGIFSEIKAENKVAYVKFQFRIKDMDNITDIGKRFVYAEEMRVKIKKNLSFYIRGVYVTSQSRSWGSGFYQIHYNIGWDFDVYIEYGQSSHTQNLAYEEEVVENRFEYDGSFHPYEGVRDMFKLSIQMKF